MTKKQKTIVTLCGNLFLSLVTLVLGIVGFAWFSRNREAKSDNSGISTSFPPSAEYAILFYDFENERVQRSDSTQIQLAAYDSIFVEDNENLAVVLEIKLMGIHSDNSLIEFILSREGQEEVLTELNQTASSIFQVGLTTTTSPQNSDELIYNWATTSVAENHAFVVKEGEQYRKTSNILITHILSEEEKNSGTVYFYLVIDYSPELVSEYTAHYELFDTNTVIDEISTFENDITALEVNVT